MPESLSFSLSFAVIGISIVFVSLAIIVGAIKLVRLADDSWQKREEEQNRIAYDKDQNIDTITLILISAAAATLVGGRFHIRHIRKLLPQNAIHGPWSAQGRAILHGSHVIDKKR